MPEMSAGTALRQLQQAHAGLKKARQLLSASKGDPHAGPRVLKAGWASLAHAHQLIAAIPQEAASDEVMTKLLSVQRYATALLVRLRRVLRHGTGDAVGTDVDDDADLDFGGDE